MPTNTLRNSTLAPETAGAALQVSSLGPAALAFALRGDLDTFTWPALARALAQAGSESVRSVELDFGEVGFIDSSAARRLYCCHVELRRRGGRLTIWHAAPAVRRVLTLLGMAELLAPL